jgi:hypothetical protein
MWRNDLLRLGRWPPRGEEHGAAGAVRSAARPLQRRPFCAAAVRRPQLCQRLRRAPQQAPNPPCSVSYTFCSRNVGEVTGRWSSCIMARTKARLRAGQRRQALSFGLALGAGVRGGGGWGVGGGVLGRQAAGVMQQAAGGGRRAGRRAGQQQRLREPLMQQCRCQWAGPSNSPGAHLNTLLPAPTLP